VMCIFRFAVMALLALLVVACAHSGNLPINQPTADANAGLAMGGEPIAALEDDLLVGLAFSGGGTRAAAFSFGVLKEIDRTEINRSGRKLPLIDHVNFVSGVSGGSVTAAYFGLKKRAALADFRERFLVKDAEGALNSRVSLINVGLGLGGGVNEDYRFRNWLDDNLFEGATFASLLAKPRPYVWINATDFYNSTPFLFVRAQFSVFCSNLAEYPISAAVAASAAVPVAFLPVVLETYPDRCKANIPAWLLKAQKNANASGLSQAWAQATVHYRDGSMKYIKLLDGGLVDNYGLSGFTIARETAETPYGPLTQREALKLRRFVFLLVDAGNDLKKDWAQKLEGPSGVEFISALSGVGVDAAARASYSAFESTMKNWRDALVRWRCGLSKAKVRKLIGPGPWNCNNLQFFIGRVDFDQLGAERARKLNAVPTRFKLPFETVDELIAAGGDSLRINPTYRKFLSKL
jgi:NTE family protein